MTDVFTAGSPPTPAQLLADAEAKLHLLQTGRLSVEIEFDGRKTRYARTDIDTLQGYVDALRLQVANRKPRYGAVGVIF